MCENSRDEKSLNDDWRKLQKTERERKDCFSVYRGAVSVKKGVKIATHSHTPRRDY